MIPARFNLMGHTITVKVVPEKQWRDKTCVGLYKPEDCAILIRGSLRPEVMQQTFVHEMTHAILYYMNHALKNDEPFVDTFASLLHQAWTTVEGPKRARKKG